VAQHPIPVEQLISLVGKALVTGGSTYNPVLNELISIEGTGIEIMMNPTVANPQSNFTSRSWNGTVWSNTANAIAASVRAEVST
jgi:type IV secretory pathway ATPase VirB11/archaellum biosynthesis ATPase